MASPNIRAGGAPDAQALLEIHFSFAPAFVLNAGVQLDVFSQVAAGKATAAEIAGAAGADERGMRMLLDALTGLQLLSKKSGRYELTPLSAEYLVRGRPNYAGAMLEQGGMVQAWSGLADAVRTGRPTRAVNEQELAEQFFPILIASLHVVHTPQAKRLADALGAGRSRHGLHVLDVACGSGVWSIALAQADPHARITAQDFPKVLETTRKYVEKSGVAKQYDYLPGDLKETNLGENRFELAVLGHIVHSEGEAASRDLFRRLHSALKPGGRVVILDMIPNDERTGPPFPLFFAINMLLNTTSGDTYTFSEYRQWLSEAGFGRLETADIGTHSPAIIATRA
jgi:ubiquinone/menaquinone biosynthesis C-methylase UbiE